ncbi:MAG: alpha/beta fold hydrolase [Actinomycetota bacterium]
MKRNGWLALAGTATGLAGGLALEHAALQRRRRSDPEGTQRFGRVRGERSRRIELEDGAQLFVEETGPPSDVGIVFVHGSTLRTDAWHYQMLGIEGRRLIFYDLRGHGLSRPKGDGGYHISRLADDLHAVLDDCRLQQAVLVGHSVGGMIALELCKSRPEVLGAPVKGLILLNSTHRPAIETIIGGAAVAQLERAVRRPFDLLGRHSTHIDRFRRVVKPSDAVFWGVAVAAFGANASPRQVDFTYDMIAETPADVIFDLIKCYRDFNVTDHLSRIRVPALVVSGTHDRLTVTEASRQLAERLPEAELALLEGCGHMSMLERHAEVNEMIEEFAGRTLDAGEAREREATSR